MNIPHPYQLFTAAQSRALDERTISEFGISGFTLMEIAGTRAADFILSNIAPNGHGLICCGKGNNAGDALVVARLLAEHGIRLSLFFVDGVDSLSPDCAKNWGLLKKTTHNWQAVSTLDEITPNTIDFVVDGLLGTGLNSELRAPYTETVEWINSNSPLTFAMDIPSGLSSDNGQVLGTAVRADYTLSFGVLKLGYYLELGYQNCGEIIFCELPFPSAFKNCTRFLLDESWLTEPLHHSKKRSHKYDGGVVYIVAGSEGLTGAAILAAQSAWSTGVGAVVLIAPKGLLEVYEKHLPQIIKKAVGTNDDLFFEAKHFSKIEEILNEKPGVLLIGPGLGRKPKTVQLVRNLLGKFKSRVVIDADALFALSGSSSFIKPDSAEWVLTPHLGELAQILNTNFTSELSRLEAAEKLARTEHITVLSKGLPSYVCSPDGVTVVTGYDTRIFARAGFGDVLAGKIAGFYLQNKSAELGCYYALLDGKQRADELLSGEERSLQPIDII